MNEIIENVHAATENALKLISKAVEMITPILESACEHHQALELGIWSDKNEITNPIHEKHELLIANYIS